WATPAGLNSMTLPTSRSVANNRATVAPVASRPKASAYGLSGLTANGLARGLPAGSNTLMSPAAGAGAYMLPATSKANPHNTNSSATTSRNWPSDSFHICVPFETYGSPEGPMATGPGPEPPMVVPSNR